MDRPAPLLTDHMPQLSQALVGCACHGILFPASLIKDRAIVRLQSKRPESNAAGRLDYVEGELSWLCTAESHIASSENLTGSKLTFQVVHGLEEVLVNKFLQSLQGLLTEVHEGLVIVGFVKVILQMAAAG